MTSCKACSRGMCIKRLDMFSNLRPEYLKELLDGVEHVEYEKGEVLFHEGSISETLYFINHGSIKLFVNTLDGKEQILHILSSGNFLGMLDLLKDGQYRFSAKAIDDCKMCTLNRKHFIRTLKDNPDMAISIIETLTDKLVKTERLVKSLATNDINSRISYLLNYLIDEYGVKKDNQIDINVPISREEMANMIGVSRETISRKLKQLEKDKIIKIITPKNITILNRYVLEENF